MPIPDADRTTPVKWEDPSGVATEAYGPTGADPQEDALQARGVYGQPATGTTDEDVFIYRDDDDWVFQDKSTGPHTLSDLVSASGITESTHEDLDTLAHDIVEDSYEEVTYSGGRLTNATTYTDAGKTTKIRELQVSYTGARVTQSVYIQYDAAGTESYRLTDVYTYSGGRLATTTRTRT